MKHKLKSDLKKLKVLLIVLTLIEVIHLFTFFTDGYFWVVIDSYSIGQMIWLFHYIVAGIFIWYIWKKLPVEKKYKTNNTLMILFLSVIGMWLWMPNKKEIESIAL